MRRDDVFYQSNQIGTFTYAPSIGDILSISPYSSQRAGLYVLGSLDGEHWKVMGGKEKRLTTDGFHDLGCETYRDNVRYLMVIMVGELDEGSHIDQLELDINHKYKV